MILCLLAPPAVGHHDDSVMQGRNGAEVVWVTANLVWHYNPWLCRPADDKGRYDNRDERPGTDPCLWPDSYRIHADTPIWDPGYWTTREAEGSRQILLLEQPWRFEPNIDRRGTATVWNRGAIAVSSCPEWQGLEGLDCGHSPPPPLYPWSVRQFRFFGEHLNIGSTRRGLHGDDPPPDPPARRDHVPPAQENSPDRHEVFGICVKPEDHNGKTGDELIAAWLDYHDREARLLGLDTRNTHNEMQGWSADALKSFSDVSNTPGQIVLWQDTMGIDQVVSVNDFHGTADVAMWLRPNGDILWSAGLVDDCIWHIDKNGGPCDPAVHKLNTTDGIVNDKPNPVLDRCKDSCYHGAWANYDALDHLPDTNTARQAAYEADHSIVPHPWIHPWARPGQGGWAPGANPNAVRQFEPPPDKYWVLQPPDWDYTLDVPAGEWEWTPHPDDPGDHPDSPWPVCVFMSAI